ncbi:CapA family protein [Bradyrhizobium tropiciagri]|uniref:CapA family protein n=1 Tax=Bradyrhizobium tropiciagri TaxID=312253 RepID=UPI00067A7BD1|nr:CapA family protein [Bradyrhizobium tropiciagri]
MNRGLVYEWTPNANLPLGGSIAKRMVDLGALKLNGLGRPQLRNDLIEVRNGGRRYRCDSQAGTYEDVAIGNAEPDCNGDFVFEAGKGGGRLDKYPFAPEDFQWRYVQAAHFGEVNTFYHLHKFSQYVGELLCELGATPLPAVITVVNAHHGVTETNGVKDGLRKADDLCCAFQGGHYRLPCKRNSVAEHHPIAVEGEIHLGPGRTLLDGGALVEHIGSAYRANASHNAGIIYHEYGHHITRHTADFRTNRLRPPARQDNRKAAIDEGTCDYWAATMLDTPHIWAFHKRHDTQCWHPRSLVSQKTMDDFNASAKADPHVNGTIWGGALWDMRATIARSGGSARSADLLVLKMLTLLGSCHDDVPDVKRTRRLRSDYRTGLSQLLKADALLHDGKYSALIRDVFAKRKIHLQVPDALNVSPRCELAQLRGGLSRIAAEEIPETGDILPSSALDSQLARRGDGDFSLIAAGDIMLGDRTTPLINRWGEDYPFAGVLPLLRRSSIVLGNLEGPFAAEAQRQDRNFSYKVDPRLASSLKRANINVVTLANNHLLDCGRQGVLETFDALAEAGVHAIGAGTDEKSAHAPAILDAEGLRIGILGYYWNRRTAATHRQPGSAIDSPAWLKADIEALRQIVDRVVLTCHWGVPYERVPTSDACMKARLAIDLGADLVIGHHPHVIQPFEVYKGRAIFYSVGNFTFGSGNSKAEGLLVAARFVSLKTMIELYPIYIKNRDPRVNYQPKIMTGAASERCLARLADMSGTSGSLLSVENGVGRLELARPKHDEAAR